MLNIYNSIHHETQESRGTQRKKQYSFNGDIFCEVVCLDIIQIHAYIDYEKGNNRK